MPRIDYNRYEIFTNDDGTIDQTPFVELGVRQSDKYEKWNSNIHRLDKFAGKYYDNPFFDFLILYANPQFISEFDIPDGYIVRIPFPFEDAKNRYITSLNNLRRN